MEEKKNYIINDIAKDLYQLDSELVLKQIRNETDLSENAIQKKRLGREKDLKELYVPAEKKNKVNINSIYTTMQTLMSVFYTDRMEVTFQPRKITSLDKAESWNRLAEFDYSEMNLEEVDYQWNWDRFFFWVGIKLLDWWNWFTNTPQASVITPLAWLPDPKWGFTIKSHRFSWFQVQDTLINLKKSWKYNNVDLINWAPFDRQEEIQRAYTEWRDLNTQGVETIDNAKYSIQHHYTIIKWAKYLVTTANQNSLIIRIYKLPAITKEEKDNPLCIPFPIALKYYSPVKWDSYGISVPDLMRDKQRAESRLFNLALMKETRNTLWDDIFYNPQKIGNSKMLTTPTVEPKAIPLKIRWDESIANAVYRIPKETQANNAFNVWSQLQFQNSLSTGLDANSLWIQGWANQTATEAQITQKNANLRFVLWTKIGKLWDAFFWELYVRSYLHHLPKKSTKYIYVTRAFGTQYYDINRENLETNDIIDIKIVSTAEKEAILNSQKADFYAISPQILADPTTPEISKRWIKRKMLRLSKLSEEEINIMVPKTVDELLAEEDVEQLNLGNEIQPPVQWQDHLTYIYAYYSANDSIEKYAAIDERMQKYIEEGWDLVKMQQAQAMQGWNTMWNIAASNASQQNAALINEWLNWVSWNINAAWL